MASAEHAVGNACRIGPNAVTRLAEALCEQGGLAAAARVFSRAGLLQHLAVPPTGMVAEDEVRRLHLALRAVHPGDEAARLAREAGQRTADYLLAHRIPPMVQACLRRLPAPLAAPLLLAAIRRHAWTFVGSGRFSARMAGLRGPARLELQGNPLCRGLQSAAPACDYYAATFERLFARLVHPAARAVELACEAQGAPACVFEIGWQPPRRWGT